MDRIIALPSIHQLRERFQALRRIDLLNANIDTIRRTIRLSIKGMQLKSSALRQGYHLYRARVFAFGLKPQSLNEISYPRAEYVTRLGRSNRLGNPLFYCSTSYSATVFEIKPKPGDYLAIGKWSLKSPLRFNHIGYSNKVLARLGSSRSLNSSPIGAMIPDKSNPAQRYVHEQVAREFAKEVPFGSEHKYKISVAVAEIWLKDVPGDRGEDVAVPMDSIMYPAIGSFGDSENFAIKPDFVDSSLVFEEVEFLRIESMLNEEDYNATTLDWANSVHPDGRIEWKGRLPQWSIPGDGTLIFKAESGRWVARNASGKIIEPH